MPSVFPQDVSFAAAMSGIQIITKPSSRHAEWFKYLASKPSQYTLYDSPVQEMDRRVKVARAPAELRVMMAISRTMERNPPREGSAGHRGSIDDQNSPPTPYEWMKAALEGMPGRWEALSTTQPRCIVCNARYSNSDMKDHIKGMHGVYWQAALVDFPRTRKFRAPMQGQDMIGMWLFVGCRMEHYNKLLTNEQEIAFNELLAVYNHISFVLPGEDFSVMGRFAALDEMCVQWFKSCI